MHPLRIRALLPCLFATVTAPGAQPTTTPVSEPAVQLSPFEVSREAVRGYATTSSTSASRVAVPVTELPASLIPGFEAAHCDRLETSSTGAVVTWSGAGDLAALQGRDVCLEFRATRTRLFSFRFE